MHGPERASAMRPCHEPLMWCVNIPLNTTQLSVETNYLMVRKKSLCSGTISSTSY